MHDAAITVRSARPAAKIPLRLPGALLLSATAAIHLPIIPQHLQEAPYIGWLFIGLALTCTALSTILFFRDDAAIWVMTLAVEASALLAYVLSRSVGLPQIEDDIGNWLDPLGLAALSVESVAVLIATLVLRRRLSGANGP